MTNSRSILLFLSIGLALVSCQYQAEGHEKEEIMEITKNPQIFIGSTDVGRSIELQEIWQGNRIQREEKMKIDGQFFSKHMQSQHPKYFWIGCSDSRVAPEQILGLGIGDIFVHRNVANQASPNDSSMIAAIDFALYYLKIDHIIVAGHTSCGGVIAASSTHHFGYLEPHLKQIRDLKARHEEELKDYDHHIQVQKLIEINVKEQMRRISDLDFVHKLWESGRNITIHGIVYNLAEGKIHEITEPIRGTPQPIQSTTEPIEAIAQPIGSSSEPVQVTTKPKTDDQL